MMTPRRHACGASGLYSVELCQALQDDLYGHRTTASVHGQALQEKNLLSVEHVLFPLPYLTLLSRYSSAGRCLSHSYNGNLGLVCHTMVVPTVRELRLIASSQASFWVTESGRQCSLRLKGRRLGHMPVHGRVCTFLLVSWISPPMMNSSRMRYTCPGHFVS